MLTFFDIRGILSEVAEHDSKSTAKQICFSAFFERAKINEKSLITYALDNLVQLKIPEAYIVIGKEGALIKNVIGNEYNKDFELLEEEKLLFTILALCLVYFHNFSKKKRNFCAFRQIDGFNC